MARINHLYNISLVTYILGGVSFSGYAEEGGVEFEYAEALGEMTIGAGGHPVFSQFNNQLVICKTTLLESTKCYREMARLMKEQHRLMRETAQIMPLPLFFRDPTNGDQVTEAYATFVQRPGPNKGKKAGERVFEIALPNAADQIQFGVLNVID